MSPTRYSSSFEPILLEGQTAILRGVGLPGGGLSVRCLAVGSIPELVIDFGALVAATWDEDNTSTDLIMPTMTLGVYRIKIITNMKARLKNPSSVRQWRTRDANFYLPQFPWDGDEFEKVAAWRSSEFMVWEDESYPAFDFYSTLTQTQSLVLFSGWRYSMERMPGEQKGNFPIWVNDWPSTRNK